MRILLIEDCDDDAALVEAHLRSAGREAEILRIQTAAEMSLALAREPLDLIISDYRIPGFGARPALRLLGESERDIPFIIVSGTIGEEVAVELMRAGARDYVMKGDLGRLVPAIDRELAGVEERAHRRATESRLREMQERFQATFEQAAVGVAHVTPDGCLLDVNEKLAEMLGCAPADLIGTYGFDWVRAEERDASRKLIDALGGGNTGSAQVERILCRRDGSPIAMSITSSAVLDESGRPKYLIAIFQDITERRRSEELVRHNASLLAASLESTRDAIVVVDFNWRIIEFNRHFARLGNYPDELLASRDGRKIVAFSLRNIVNRRALWADLELLQQDHFREASGVWETRDGHIIEWFTAPHLLDGCAVGRVWSFKDATTRVHSQRAAERLAVIVEQAAEMILMTGVNGVIEYVNPAFELHTGYSRAEAVGRTPEVLLGKKSDEFDMAMWSTIRRGDVWKGRFVNTRKDGSLIHEDATISPVRDAGGTIVNYVAIKRDVSNEVALAEQLRHTQKLEAIGTLAGGVAHDFNNLLQGMLTYVQLLQSPKVGLSKRGDYLLQLENGLRRGSQLTRQLLLFARREPARREPLDLGNVVRDLSKFLRRVVRENIRLNVDLSTTPIPLDGDRGQLEQVVMNLVVNAMDAMPEGGTLSIRTGCDQTNGWLEVVDSGSGVPEAIRERIFEPFFTTKEPGRGTGLGLSVVHGIVTAHEGNITVTSDSHGSLFRVNVPLRQVASLPAGDAASAAEIAPGSGKRVLVVEDAADVRAGLQDMLEILGYNVTVVAAGEQLTEIETSLPVAVVLTDSMLPGMSGLEVIDLARKRWPAAGAILMSGYPEVINNAAHDRTYGFLMKPFGIDDLGRMIGDTLSRAAV